MIDALEMCRKFVAIRRHKQRTRKLKAWACPLDPYEAEGRAKGMTYLGSGAFGEAWLLEEFDLVLKISGPCSWGYDEGQDIVAAHDVEHDAWPIYAEYARDNPHKHLPCILHVERVSEHITWALMERLYPHDEVPVASRQHQAICWEWREYLDGAEPHPPRWMWPIKTMSSALRLRLDLHTGNVLYRLDGTPVLTDPFSVSHTKGWS